MFFQSITGQMWVVLIGLFLFISGIITIIVSAFIILVMVKRPNFDNPIKKEHRNGVLDAVTVVCWVNFFLVVLGLLMMFLPDLNRMITRT